MEKGSGGGGSWERGGEGGGGGGKEGPNQLGILWAVMEDLAWEGHPNQLGIQPGLCTREEVGGVV